MAIPDEDLTANARPMSGILDPLIGAGFFSPNMSLEEIKRRRAIAGALASRARAFPKTIGEGMTYFGEALGDALQERRLSEAEKGYNERYNKAAGVPGSDTLPPIAPPPAPVVDVSPEILPPPVATAAAAVPPPPPPPTSGARPSPLPPAPAGPMTTANASLSPPVEPVPGGNRADITRVLALRNPALADMIAQIGGQGAAPAGPPMVTANASLATPNTGAAPAGDGPDGVTVSDEGGGPNPPIVTDAIRPMRVAQVAPPAARTQPTATPSGTLAPVIPESLPDRPAPMRSERLTPNEQHRLNILRQFPNDPRAIQEFNLAKEIGTKAREAEYEREKAQHDVYMRAKEARETARQTAITNAPKTAQDLQKGAAEVTAAQAAEQARLQWGNLPAPVQKDLFDSRDAAKAAAGSISAMNNAEAVLNAGTVVGPGATIALAYHKARAIAGNEASQKIVANTQSFQASLGPAVMAAVKAYGGPQVSNTDREYAAAMVGSDIALSESAIRRILDIGKRSAAAAMAEHRAKADEHAKDAPALRKFLEVSDPLAASPAPSETTKPTAAPRSFTSEAEAEAAGLPKGTPVIINGRRGRIQ